MQSTYLLYKTSFINEANVELIFFILQHKNHAIHISNYYGLLSNFSHCLGSTSQMYEYYCEFFWQTIPHNGLGSLIIILGSFFEYSARIRRCNPILTKRNMYAIAYSICNLHACQKRPVVKKSYIIHLNCNIAALLFHEHK